MTIKQTTDKQTINWPTILFETDYFPFEKKNMSQSGSNNPRPLSSRSYSLPPG